MWNLLLVLERLVQSSSLLILGKVLQNCSDVRCGVDQGSQPMWSMNFFAFDVMIGWIFLSAERAGIYSLQLYCSSQPCMVHWLSSSIFPCFFVVCPTMVASDQISIFSLYTGIKALFSPTHLIQAVLSYTYPVPTSTALYWPSTSYFIYEN